MVKSPGVDAVSREKRGGRGWVALWWPWGMVVIAWGTLLLTYATGLNRYIDHDYLLVASHLPWTAALLLFLLSWQIMLVAMMLPALLPLIATIALYERTYVYLRQCLFWFAYATVWTVFAVFAFLGDMLLHRLVADWWWLYEHARYIGAGILALAALVQVSPLKNTCLRHCAGFARLYRGDEERSLHAAWEMGWRYGWYCTGSCWAIMLVMVAIGMQNVISIVLLALVILIERELATIRYTRFVVGAIFLVLAGLWLVFPWR